ncbi:MAG TPA: hypothetical protein VMY77_06230 [Chitinophagaceae bacterium]|nr:hypothetical protein [Chitinophagaceae bacterium]
MLLLTLTANTQSLPEKLGVALDSLDQTYPQEKIFVHTDRSIYNIEETIWFKAYTVLDGIPSILSRIIYIELVNQTGSVIEKRMLPLNNGNAYGDIFINKELPPGTYTLNAYSLWMLNFPEYIFQKKITIYNPDTKALPEAPDGNIRLLFMPEGGDIIEGLTSKVAFKITDINGDPVDAAGDIINSKNNKVVSIKTIHDGMGVFELLPEKEEQYKAVFSVNGRKISIDIPKPKKEGITLSVDNESLNTIYFHMQRSQLNSSAYNSLYFVGRMNNSIIYSTQINFDEGKTAGGINKKKFPSGILQLTVFNESGIPLVERLVFINNYQVPDIPFTTDSQAKGKRQKNKYTIDLSLFKNISASVSVVNYKADSSIYDDNLLTSLLLTSEIKGLIKEPGYYFKDKKPETIKNQDLVMMTHGWRRIVWKKIIEHDSLKLKYGIESDITIKGIITRLNGKTLANSRMDFITKTEDSTTILSSINIDSKNEFVLSGLNFKKTASIYYQGTNNKKEKELTAVKFLHSHYDTLKRSNYFFVRKSTPEKISVGSYYQKLLAEKNEKVLAMGKVLKEIVIKSKRLSKEDSLTKIYANDFFINSEYTIALTDQKIYSVWQYLQSRISGITVGRNEFGETTVFLRNHGFNSDSTPSMFIADPTTNIDFYLNEIKVSKETIESIDPLDFVLVKIWKATSSATIGSEQGAIAFYTEKGKISSLWKVKGFDMINKEGYSVSREFVAMDYKYIPADSVIHDVRPTLYWNPNLKPDKNGQVSIQFYNDDEAAELKITLMGIDQEGRVVSQQKIIGLR